MQAIVCQKYGDPLDVLQLVELEKPVPAENQVLVKVLAASLNVADLAPVRGVFLARLLGTGLLKPKDERLGTDLAGRVEAVGKKVTLFQPGDEVFGAAPGSFAEYACAREDRLALKPANVTFEAAATTPVAATTALQGIRLGRIQPGQRVIVYGASGGVGMFTLQIAKSFRTEVTAVCSPANLEAARAMGADHVIDYTREDFTRGGVSYDLILAANGKRSIWAYRAALTPKGTYVALGGQVGQVAQALLLGRLLSQTNGRRMSFMGIAKLNREDMLLIRELLESGKVTPLIEKRYPLSETAQALHYLGEGHARSKLVITV